MAPPPVWRRRAVFLALVLAVMGPTGAESNDRLTVLPVSLTDPVAPELPPRPYDVVVASDRDGAPAGYQLTFRIDVCADKQCRMVHLTMVWDALGHYQRLDCPPETPLTRREHDPFTPDDYRKLDRILKNRESILGRLSFEALVEQPQPEQAEDVDGWSGATPQTVADSVVEGAAFTTWTLWHWANGEIVPHLRASTKQRATPQYVRRLLRSEDHREVGFVLREVLAQSPPEEPFIDDVFHVLESTKHVEYIELALAYVCRAVPDPGRLHERLIKSACRMGGYTSRPILDYFASQPDLPAETLEGLSGALAQLPYFPVHRILKVLEKHESSAKVEANIVRLLEHDDFFIARRAYGHLMAMKHTHDDRMRDKLNAFHEQYRDRL